jgi:MFS family permease
MPLHIFKAPTFSALISVLLLSYMGAGIDLWYAVAWLQQLRSISVLQTGIYFIPFGCTALIAVFLAAWLISRVRAEFILAIGIAMVVATSLLLATMPIQQTYWAQVFPAFLLAGFCPDLIFVAAQVIASGSVNRKQQGIASSLIGTLNLYGTSLGLGIGATIESEVTKTRDEATGFRAALYFAAGIALVALAIDFTFVRVPRDRREGWESPAAEELQPVATVTAVEVTPAHRD